MKKSSKDFEQVLLETAKASEPLRRSLLDLENALLQRRKEVEKRKARVEEEMKRGSRTTKHRFSL